MQMSQTGRLRRSEPVARQQQQQQGRISKSTGPAATAASQCSAHASKATRIHGCPQRHLAPSLEAIMRPAARLPCPQACPIHVTATSLLGIPPLGCAGAHTSPRPITSFDTSLSSSLTSASPTPSGPFAHRRNRKLLNQRIAFLADRTASHRLLHAPRARCHAASPFLARAGALAKPRMGKDARDVPVKWSAPKRNRIE